jgi:long-chain acyl-CoA synthetase
MSDAASNVVSDPASNAVRDRALRPDVAVDDFVPRWSSFADFFRSRTDLDTPFLTWPGDRDEPAHWSVGAWRANVAAVCSWLESQGTRPGSSVATLLGNTPEALLVAYACWAMEACVVPLNPADTADRMAAIVRDAEATLLVWDPALGAGREALAAAVSGPVQTRDQLPLHPDSAPAPNAPLPVGESLEAPALRVYTSGTTGDPKGVALSARNILVDCDALAQGLQWPADTRILTVLPVHHVNGLIISSVLPWVQGWSTVLRPRFAASSFWADVDRHHATACSVVPTVLELLLAHDTQPRPGLREILCGAGPLLVSTALSFEDRFAIPIRHLYGLSETTAVCCLMPSLPTDARRRWHEAFGFPSIGPALPHAEVGVVTDLGQPAPAGERGEIVARGAMVMNGYANRPQATADVFRDGWFHTGDEGFWQPDDDGTPFYFISGRIKEIIIRGGANIAPVEIDEVLRSHPAVEAALSFGFEHQVFGEEVAAYVVARRAVSADELARHCAQQLDTRRCPKVYVFGKEVPFTATGKAKRLQLKRELAAALAPWRSARFDPSGQTAPALHLDSD